MEQLIQMMNGEILLDKSEVYIKPEVKADLEQASLTNKVSCIAATTSIVIFNKVRDLKEIFNLVL